MVDSTQMSRAGSVVLGAVAALLVTPAVGWADRSDPHGTTAAGDSTTASPNSSASKASPKPSRGVTGVATRVPRLGTVSAGSEQPAPAPRVRGSDPKPAAASTVARQQAANSPQPTAQQVSTPPARNWFERTFNNATPTFAPQVSPVNLSTRQSSGPIALAGFDADGDALTYSTAGTGSAGGVIAVNGGTVSYTPPESWTGTAAYTDVFTVSVSDAGNGWHVHGLAGLLHMLTFGLLGAAGDTATGSLTVQVNPVSSSEPSVVGPDPEPDPEPPVTDPPVTEQPVAPGSFPVAVVNNTAGAYADDQIFLTIFGQTSPGQWAWVDADGEAHQLDHTAADADGHLMKGGKNYADMSFTLAESAGLRIPPKLEGARIYLSLGQPLYIGISPDDTGWAGPDPMNPTDPNIDTVYDWYEMTYEHGRIPFGGNTTQVDLFGLPFTFTLTQGVSGYSATRGIELSRDEVFRRFEATMPEPFRALIIKDDDGNPLRLVAPRSYQPGALASWFDEPVEDFWTKYRSEQFTYHGPGFTVTGGIDAGDRFNYTVTSAAGASTSHTMVKPTTAEVFRADGPFLGTALQGAFLAHLDAAFHRGVATDSENWDNASAYYPAGGRWNNWSDFFHTNSVGGYAYGFPYDDVNSQSSVLILTNAQPLTELLIAVGN